MTIAASWKTIPATTATGYQRGFYRGEEAGLTDVGGCCGIFVVLRLNRSPTTAYGLRTRYQQLDLIQCQED